jgi:ABC-type multidrug transport system fused ATPase/permease subunit
MAKKVKARGSIIYKIIIVVLVVGLIWTIEYPKTLWKNEGKNAQLCRNRMEHILYAELIYLSYSGADTYTDTLKKAVDFIKSDTTGLLLKRFTDIDSTLAETIYDVLEKDTTAAAIIDTLYDYGYAMDLDTTNVLILDSLRTYEKYKRVIDSMALNVLDELFLCPTVLDSYKIVVLDTSVIKELYIYCPIDSLDSLRVAKDFLLNKIGGLRISNHGAIENGDRSWSEED